MNASGSSISAVTQDLWLKWQQTKDSWHDSKSLEFEARFLAELIPTVDKTISTIDELDKLLNKIRKDCE